MNDEQVRTKVLELLGRMVAINSEIGREERPRNAHVDYRRGGHKDYTLEKVRGMKHNLILQLELIGEVEKTLDRKTYHDIRTFQDFDKPFVRCSQCSRVEETVRRDYVCRRCLKEKKVKDE